MANSPGRPRQIAVNDPLWDIFADISEDSGHPVDSLVSQAMFEMAVRLGYLKPVAKDGQAPLSDDPSFGKPTQPPDFGRRFSPGKTKDSGRNKPIPKRPPRPAPRPSGGKPSGVGSLESKGAFILNESGQAEKIDKDIYIIGRSSKCDLVINSVKVSREHAIITRERGEYYIEDLGSANGTWHKGEKIEKMKIQDGDEIFICDEKFKFVFK